MAFQVALLVIFALKRSDTNVDLGEEGSYFPFWIVFLIPIFVASRKGQKLPKGKRRMIVLIVLAVFLLLGIVFFGLWGR